MITGIIIVRARRIKSYSIAVAVIVVYIAGMDPYKKSVIFRIRAFAEIKNYPVALFVDKIQYLLWFLTIRIDLPGYAQG